MFGKLERDGLGRILCDKCGKSPKQYTARTTKFLLNYLNLGWSPRKLFHLCIKCCREFSALARKEFTK